MYQGEVREEPVRTVDVFERLGVLQRIRNYETEHRFSASPIQDHNATRIITGLDLALGDGEVLSIDFHGFVGRELVGQRVIYKQTTEIISGRLVDERAATQDTVTQELLSEDNGFPTYKAIEVNLVKH